ncbi:MAG: LicD family protein [uncultured Sulfurovum sp.]|uniref:LicD family protein n=1 Tax=uncultured Sulfurovum sp. TaxID=269237 RepID=A0A6S6SZH5_9BACT|nr:MAG: LicD family protein [uncultured Sulfurovum sp.]
MKDLILLIEKNKFMAKIFRFFYRKIFVKYKLYKQNKNFLKYAEETLIQVNHIFKELDIQYWLEYGTLLGAIRDKSFIKHDLDIDLGIFLDDYSEDMEIIFKRYGFKKIRNISIDNNTYGLEESYVYKDIVIDLFYFTLKDNKMYSHVFKNEEGKSWHKTILDNGGLIVREMTFPYDGFTTINFLGKQYPVPKNADEHLKSFYGEKYMIKDTEWNPYTMAKNVKTLDNKIGVYKSYG